MTKEQYDLHFNQYFGNQNVRSPDIEEKKEEAKKSEVDMGSVRQMADGNIDDIEQLASILKKLCNAAWGTDWGELSPDLKKGEDVNSLLLPQITMEINEKDIAAGYSLKPTLFDTIIERDASGKKTGEIFFLYRQWFDCNIEFNIYGQSSVEARKLKNNFQKLLAVYSGYLKRHGISEMLFEKEVHSKMSLNYNSKAAMIPIYYYVKFEEITVVKKSVLDKIDISLGIKSVDAEKIVTIIEKGENLERGIDLHFYAEDDQNDYEF